MISISPPMPLAYGTVEYRAIRRRVRSTLGGGRRGTAPERGTDPAAALAIFLPAKAPTNRQGAFAPTIRAVNVHLNLQSNSDLRIRLQFSNPKKIRKEQKAIVLTFVPSS